MVTVETTAGRLAGVEEDGLVVFKGVRFAAPPVGDRRWRPPGPVQPWTGVRPADTFGWVAPQTVGNRPDTMTGERMPQNEDCLHLNVWTPGADGNRRPVMVWIHGGAFLSGSGAGQLYWGDRLARRGDVVVVTINYRLGVLGFLAHPDLADGDSGIAGSWGLLDQIAALRWVQDNITAFGGDANNVTIFGESAGAMSVSSLLAMPAATGLFHKAIAQSGGPVGVPFEAGIETTDAVAGELGMTDNLHQLREVPLDRLLAAQDAVAATRFVGGALPFVPVIDGVALPEAPLSAIESGSSAHVSLMAGTNLDEMTFFSIGDRGAFGMEHSQLLRRVTRLFGDVDEATAIVDAYAKARGARRASITPTDLWMAIQTDHVFRVPCTRMLQAQQCHQSNTYSYLFTWRSPALGGILGSCHALELPFVLGKLDLPGSDVFVGSGPDAERLSARMQDSWLSFARTGRPSATGLDPWPAYGEARSTMVFDAECAVEDAPMEVERAFWDGRI